MFTLLAAAANFSSSSFFVWPSGPKLPSLATLRSWASHYQSSLIDCLLVYSKYSVAFLLFTIYYFWYPRLPWFDSAVRANQNRAKFLSTLRTIKCCASGGGQHRFLYQDGPEITQLAASAAVQNREVACSKKYFWLPASRKPPAAFEFVLLANAL